VINQCFSDKTAQIIEGEWIAIDGKVMRGSLDLFQGRYHSLSV
jgi:hypothetical protein